MAVSKKSRALYWAIFDGFETWCANVISRFQENRYLHQYMTKEPIPKDFKEKYRRYWSRYNVKNLRNGVKYAWYYASQNGIYDPRYISNTLMYTVIDQHFNDRKLGWGFNDKNYYDKIFCGIKQPKTLVRKVKGFLLDKDYNQISFEQAIAIISSEQEVICKPTLESGSGREIRFWHVKNNQKEIQDFLLDHSQEDYIVQEIVKQNPNLEKVHAKSLNTIRIISLLMEDGVHILSSVLRMGLNDSRTDNATSGGEGITCGILANGTLKNYATGYYTGKQYRQHPQGFVFKGFKVPGYLKAIQLVKRAHPMIAHFRLVSWDIAINYENDPILIEANMRKGGINLHQFNNGPLFGDLTDQVLTEVFGKR